MLKIQPFTEVDPRIYAYTTPGVIYHEGWIKIGYTEGDVETRIREQVNTVGIRYKLEWEDQARYTTKPKDYFRDHDFHHYLVVEKNVEREERREWFRLEPDKSKEYFDLFASRSGYLPPEGYDYVLREEQQNAVSMTKTYFENGGKEFLWNAKPRFGKTLTAYDLIRKMQLKKVLIVTNRPSVANSWADDFRKFIAFHDELCFVSETDALKDKPGVMTKRTYDAHNRALIRGNKPAKGIVAFESLQGLKGSVYFGGRYNKLDWMAKEYRDGQGRVHHGMEFDLLIVDESQEGVDTIRTDQAFDNINRKYTLYMSGTPFKALAHAQFGTEQIYNWSYVDEQEAKASWNGEENNPYEELPNLALYTYKLSNMIQDRMREENVLPSAADGVDYVSDLKEFFRTNGNGVFVHKDEVKKFLHALVTQEKYPFSTPELRQELSHTLWLLNRVDSAKALKRLLEEDQVFKDYKVVLAAGNGRSDETDIIEIERAFDRVRTAITENEKTITLSVGQLTVGVTIPEWSGVLMLCNLESPSAYMQAAFRTQNPCAITKDEKRFRKETAYIFDFDPARTLVVFDKFANNLYPATAGGRGTSSDNSNNIKRLLNFFPVLGEDTEGKMVELNAAQVLSFPRRIKCEEVVRRGFMSNFLFINIDNVFRAPKAVGRIIGKMIPAPGEFKKRESRNPDLASVKIDETGNVEISDEAVIKKTEKTFKNKYYDKMEKSVVSKIPDFTEIDGDLENIQLDQQFANIVETTKAAIKENVVAPAAKSYKLKDNIKTQLAKEACDEFEESMNRIQADYKREINIAEAEYESILENANSKEEIENAGSSYRSSIKIARASLTEAVQNTLQDVIENDPQKIVERIEKLIATGKKDDAENLVKKRLRGFCRSIPSFIMAYGNEDLTLENFDERVDDNVFKEVTGITLSDFRLLRDGGTYTDGRTGKKEYFEGNVFDEGVFNDSIKEFWKKKQNLARYFDETLTEDIFDYIPPQKTNQIFTPKWVVARMVDELENNNPGCFDDPTKTFVDLYMKSGLYVTEIVKRLFRSSKMKDLYPDDGMRIRHILQNQVYGMAPTRIIYLIAMNYIFGPYDQLKAETKNFVEADAAKAAKEGKLDKLIKKHFKNRTPRR